VLGKKLSRTRQDAKAERPRHNFFHLKKIEAGPRIILKVLRGFFRAVCSHHKEDVRRPFQWSSKNHYASCLKLVHKPSVSFPLLLAFQWKSGLPGGATRADHGE